MKNNDKSDPTQYGLSSRVKLKEISNSHITIIKDRKSRIIMKDSEVILDQAKKIQSIYPTTKVSVTTSAPICSKTRDFLKEMKIEFLELKK